MVFLSQLVKTKPSSFDPKNSEELVFNYLDKNLNKWIISHINLTKVYNKWLFDSKQSYIIKTFEKSISISITNKSVKVLDELKQEYKYIHLRLIQVATKLVMV